MPSKSNGNGTWSKNGGPEYLGGYEYVNKSGKSYSPYVRMFTLVRIPTRGPIKKKTLYFSSPNEAVKKGWIKN